MELQYTYWQEKDGWYIGYFDDFPDHPTQGETLEELEYMLKDLYEIMELSKYHKAKLFIA
jgi:predicted RNase H-like HicB family nuclease